jgi:hypothetical protein
MYTASGQRLRNDWCMTMELTTWGVLRSARHREAGEKNQHEND